MHRNCCIFIEKEFPICPTACMTRRMSADLFPLSCTVLEDIALNFLLIINLFNLFPFWAVKWRTIKTSNTSLSLRKYLYLCDFMFKDLQKHFTSGFWFQSGFAATWFRRNRSFRPEAGCWSSTSPPRTRWTAPDSSQTMKASCSGAVAQPVKRLIAPSLVQL